MKLSKLHKKLNWRKLGHDLLRLSEIVAVLAVCWGILVLFTWIICKLIHCDFDLEVATISWAVPLVLDGLTNVAYDWANEVRDWY